MYAGRIVEQAPVRDIFHQPQHPYTKALLESVPKTGVQHSRRLPAIEGIVPSLYELPAGCRFHDRCGFCEDRCVEEEPLLEEADPNRHVRCHFPLEI